MEIQKLFSGVRSSSSEGKATLTYVLSLQEIPFSGYVLYEPRAMILIKPEIGSVICRLALTKSERDSSSLGLHILSSAQLGAALLSVLLSPRLRAVMGVHPRRPYQAAII